MIVAPNRPQLVEDLRRMMDELCEPDLTLARAEILRPRVNRILEALRAGTDASSRGRQATTGRNPFDA